MLKILEEIALSLGLIVVLHIIALLLNVTIIDVLIGAVCYMLACKILRR